MANSEMFVNPEEIRVCANRLKQYAEDMNNTLEDFRRKEKSTEEIYECNSATDMRDKFATLEPELEKFTAYLRKVAAYLTQNVAEPAEVVDQIAAQNVASIRKPQ